MKSVAKGVGLLLTCSGGDDARLLLLIRSVFPAAAGQAAGRLHPHSIHAGELVLMAADERWLSAGRDNLEQLRRALNRRLGREVVERIRIRLGELPDRKPVPAEPESAARKKAPPADAAESAAIIRDERARRAFLELAAGVAALRERGKPRE